jgi:hypothetical protein
VSQKDNEQTSDQAAGETTSAFRADLLGELDAAAAAAAEAGVWGVDGLPSGSAVVVVKRGPNAGSRFRLDQPVTTAGHHSPQLPRVGESLFEHRPRSVDGFAGRGRAV